MPKDKSNSPKAEQQRSSQLSDEQLAEASAGATEELKGAYNFLLEVAGVTGLSCHPDVAPQYDPGQIADHDNPKKNHPHFSTT